MAIRKSVPDMLNDTIRAAKKYVCREIMTLERNIDVELITIKGGFDDGKKSPGDQGPDAWIY
jgi:hypothetical protein